MAYGGWGATNTVVRELPPGMFSSARSNNWSDLDRAKFGTWVTRVTNLRTLTETSHGRAARASDAPRRAGVRARSAPRATQLPAPQAPRSWPSAHGTGTGCPRVRP